MLTRIAVWWVIVGQPWQTCCLIQGPLLAKCRPTSACTKERASAYAPRPVQLSSCCTKSCPITKPPEPVKGCCGRGAATSQKQASSHAASSDAPATDHSGRPATAPLPPGTPICCDAEWVPKAPPEAVATGMLHALMLHHFAGADSAFLAQGARWLVGFDGGPMAWASHALRQSSLCSWLK